MIFGIFQFLAFFESASQYVHVDPHVIDESISEAKQQIGYHRIIVRVAMLLGATGFVLGLVCLYFFGSEQLASEGPRLLAMPLVFAAIGVVVGVVLTCTFAPRRFFESPVGERWMALIGTRNVAVGRIVCLLLLLVVVGIPSALLVFVLMNPHP